MKPLRQVWGLWHADEIISASTSPGPMPVPRWRNTWPTAAAMQSITTASPPRSKSRPSDSSRNLRLWRTLIAPQAGVIMRVPHSAVAHQRPQLDWKEPLMTDPDADGPAGELNTLPVFEIPQSAGTSVTLDFTTTGPFGDFAFTAHVPQADETVRERVYGAYHTEEAAIFVEILQHWARVADSDDIVAGLDHADNVLRSLTDGLEPTTQSERNFDFLLETGMEPLAVADFPADHEHADERGDLIVLAPRGADLYWISQRSPSTTFSVLPSHLWILVTGMMWRTYEHDTIPLTRLNTAEYESVIAAFRKAIRSRSET